MGRILFLWKTSSDGNVSKEFLCAFLSHSFVNSHGIVTRYAIKADNYNQVVQKLLTVVIFNDNEHFVELEA